MSSIGDELDTLSGWVDRFSTWTCRQLEASTLPAHGTTMHKIACYAYQIFQFCLFLPIAAIVSTAAFFITRAIRLIVPHKPMDPLTEFAQHPIWDKPLETLPIGNDGRPIDIGFSSADIQDSGPHIKRFEGTNWGRFYEQNKAKIGDLSVLPDVIRNPKPLIDEYRRRGWTQFRTSISLMPKEGKPLDKGAVANYCSFFRKLVAAGITPMVTLNHFVNPEDLDWTKAESIDRYVQYVKNIADSLHDAGVRKVLTFNEPTVYAFQGWIRGQFPPHHTMDFEGAGAVIKHMMQAHVKVYAALKEKHSDFEIGLTHDPIRFQNYHDWNPLFAPSEKITCHYLNEICHNATMRFLQTGKFSLQVPFLANCQFEIPEFASPETRPLDYIGLQYYTDPLLQFPWGSVTDQPGEKLSSYKYRTYPQGLASAIQEMSTLGVPIDLTEIGIDTGINHQKDSDKERIEYFEKVIQVVQLALDQGINIRSLGFWTKDRSWEWAEGMNVDFSWYNDAKQPRPVVDRLQQKIDNTYGRARTQIAQ